MNTNTQTETAERGPVGHYEVDYGKGWKHVSENRVRSVMRAAYHRMAPILGLLRDGEVVRTTSARYRYMRD